MTKTTRWGMQVLLISGLATVGALVGCSSDDTGTTPPAEDTGTVVADTGTPDTAKVDTGTPDSGSGETGPVPDSGTPDSPDTGPPPEGPKVSLIHGAAGIGAVRFCISLSAAAPTFATDAVLLQYPTTAAGLPYGFGGQLKVDPTVAVALTSLAITPLALQVSKFPDEKKTCKELIPSFSPLPDGVTKFETIKSGTFLAKKSYAIAALGCPAGVGTDAAAKAGCGSAYDNVKGNLRLQVIELDKDTKVDGTTKAEWGAQFLHLSPTVGAAAAGGVIGAFVTGADPATAVVDEIGLGQAPNGTDPVKITALKVFGTVTRSSLFQAYAADATGKRGPALLGPGVPIASIESATTGLPTPPEFILKGKSFTYIAIGDATKKFPTDLTGLRIIALANDP